MKEDNFTKNLTRVQLLSYISFLDTKIGGLEKIIDGLEKINKDLNDKLTKTTVIIEEILNKIPYKYKRD